MTDKTLRQSNDAHTPVSNGPDLDRLFGMMSRWWEGWSAARIAAEVGVSRQRARRILIRFGCARKTLRLARRRRPSKSGRRATDRDAALARELLLRPGSGGLTVRQRAALAWRAQGLATGEIARRMDVSSQAVNALLLSARLRIERPEVGRGRRSRADANLTGPADIGDFGLIDLGDPAAQSPGTDGGKDDGDGNR